MPLATEQPNNAMQKDVDAVSSIRSGGNGTAFVERPKMIEGTPVMAVRWRDDK